MTKISGWLTAILMAGALALPVGAVAQQHRHFGAGGGGGGGGQVNIAKPSGGFARSGGIGSIGSRPAMRTFTPHVGGRSFTPRIGRRAITPRYSGRSVRFGTIHRGTSFTRSIRTQGVHRLTRRNATIHTMRKAGVRRDAQRTLRRIGTTGITPQVARQGRFGSKFAAQAGKGHYRPGHMAAHRAWRHHRRAGFVAWYGPIFWPYAYSDIFDYAFWPWGYDDGYWYYAYDDFFDGVFWGEYGPPEDYAYAYAAPAAPRASRAGVQELCTQPGTGITAWPFAEIERKVGLNDEQKQLLADVRKAAADAAATFKASCPAKNAFPLTPPGRLQAMMARLQGTLDAVKIVRPALDKFYASLSDEQKERFNALGPKRPATSAEASAALPQDAKACSEAKPGLATLPIERIKDVVKPTDAQQDALKQLQDATDKAVSVLQAACPDETPLTPPGRLQAMEKRLQAMVDAANTVKPALEGFYASLSAEQKARFNRIGRELAQGNG